MTTIDIPTTVQDLGLKVELTHPAVLALSEGRYDEAVYRTDAELSGPQAADFVVLHILSRALARHSTPLDARKRELFRVWLKREDVRNSLFRSLFLGPVIREVSPATLECLVRDLARDDEDLTPLYVGLAGFLAPQERERALEELARHPRDEIREHFFALLCEHRRLSPPGTIELAQGAESEFSRLLSIGMRDSNARVRERAIAAAYGLGLVPRVHEAVIALSSDADVGVRQYAIIALGVLDDEVSREVLHRVLHGTSDKETTSAIWAAARRQDLIEEVIGMAGDGRDWVNNELLGAFAEVSVALTDEQISELQRRTNFPRFAPLRDRHIARTRRGQPEVGPDNQIYIEFKR